jgi:dipeptidyl aminopeptidase/acylaminoacyl peptidase
VNLESRARAAADSLRAAYVGDAEAGLARLRRTSRRRSAVRVAAAAAVVAGLLGGVAVARDEPDRTAPPADHEPVENPDLKRLQNGIIVSSVGGDEAYGQTPPSELPPLTDPGTAPFPVWQGFDQDSGRFLFTGNEGPGSLFDDTATVRVLAPGLDAPVATINCVDACNWPAFGPEPDEVTAVTEDFDQPGWPPRTAQVYGFDGSLQDEFDLSGVLGGSEPVAIGPGDDAVMFDFGIADMAWSPDGTQLAVSTFTGSREPICTPASACEARIWIVNRAGGDPVLIHRQSTPSRADPNPWLLTDLAWAPDGERLALASTRYYHERPPTLVIIAVASGQAQTVHEFDDCGACNPVNFGFAWSPDGTRIAVTSGADIALLTPDGTPVDPAGGDGNGPLAWLARTSE